MLKRKTIFFLVLLVLIVTGCAKHFDLRLDPKVGIIPGAKPFQASAALLIPPDIRNYKFIGKSSPAGTSLTAVLPLGKALEKASYQAFSQFFPNMEIIESAVEAKNFDITLEPSIENFSYELVRASFASGHAVANSKIGLSLYLRGERMWTENFTSETVHGPEGSNWEDTAQSIRKASEDSLISSVEAAVSGMFRVREVKTILAEFPSTAQALADQSSSISQQAASKIGAKPSIYIAYPKGGEEMAEDSVNVVGYVSSANQTKDFAVSVNRFPLNLSSLWTGTVLDTKGLRGYPVELTLPLQLGENRIELQVKDEDGFVERKTLVIKRIEIKENLQATAVTELPSRLANVEVAERSGNVSADNFMEVLGNWIKDTAKTDYNKANAMFDQGRYARAAYYYKKSIKTDPLGNSYFNLGLAEKAQSKDGPAAEAFKKACDLKIIQACNQVRS